MLILSDNTGALTVVGNASYCSTANHIALGFFFVREMVREGKITSHLLPTDTMLADCGTNDLAKAQFRSIIQQLQQFSRSLFPCYDRKGFLKMFRRLAPCRSHHGPPNSTTTSSEAHVHQALQPHQTSWTPAWRVGLAATTTTQPTLARQ